MYQVDFDKFNIILDNLLNQYNCYNKNAKEFFFLILLIISMNILTNIK